MKKLNYYYQQIVDSFMVNQFLLLMEMTVADLRSKYRNTFFGFGWTVIHPIIQTIIMSFTLSNFLKVKGDYSLFLYSGLLIWNFFSLSIIEGTRALIDKRDLIHKSRFNYFIIPTATVLSHFVRLIFSTVFLFVYAIYLGNEINLFFYAFSLLTLLFFTANITVIFSFLNVVKRDIGFVVNSLTYLVFYITPVIYDTYFLPDLVKGFIKHNPLVEILSAFRNGFSFQYEINFVYLYLLVSLNVLIFIALARIINNKKISLSDYL